MTFQQIFFLCWIAVGISFAVFRNIKTKDTASFVDLFFIMLGPGGWINIGLIAIFQKHYRKKPRLITEITFLISTIIAIILLYSVFPEIFNS